MWWAYAVGSAVFAALTSILAKIGIENVNSNLATAIRTIVVLILAWGMVFLTGSQSGIKEISSKSWLFLILLRFGHWPFLAMLLSCDTGWRRIQGCTH